MKKNSGKFALIIMIVFYQIISTAFADDKLKQEPITPAFSTSKVVANKTNENFDSVSEAFKNGQAHLSLRYRYEGVDQDGISRNAKASTLRSSLGFETAKFKEIRAVVEVEDVHVLGNDMYNDTINGKTYYPVVADPEGTRIVQSYLGYEGVSDTKLKGGRRILNLDDERFVGAVGWRQNSQTYDGIELANNSIKDTTLFYNWNYQVNRIFGEDSEKDKFDAQAHFFNVKNKNFKNVDLTAFSYLLDLDNADTLSSKTFGFRANGKTNLDTDLIWLYDISYAYQSDYADNPASFSANYYHIASGLGVGAIQGLIGYEVLGSDNGESAFQTPLATLHKFNGWADMFLTTPANGLTDAYAKLTGNLEKITDKLSGFNLEVVFHDFRADEGNDHYGNEWDYALSKTFSSDISMSAHYADYNAISNATDTAKIWLTLSTKFST